MTMSHVVADGFSAFHLLSEWARLGRGEPLGEAPFLDRMVLQNPDTNDHVAPTTSDDDDDGYVKTFFNRLPLLIGETTTSDGVETTKEEGTAKATLELTKNQLEALKKKAATKIDYEGLDADAKYSRFEVVTAHAWKCACKARGHESAQPTALALCVDVRRRMRPPLPKNYFGNAIVDVLASSCSGEIVSKPLGFACGRIREAVRRVSDEYVNAITRYLKNQPDVSGFQFDNILNALASGGDLDEEEEEESLALGDPNLAVTTWVNLPICGIDFGWGKELYMAPDYEEFDGSLMLLPGRNGDGSIAVAVCLQIPHMDAFKKFFYEDIQPQK